jgi:dihydrofolate reductase
MKPCISIIVAMAKNRTIGINNSLPWCCPEDLKHFKALTMGHHIIMGRKTYESIGRPLPGRTTVIVTRNNGLKVDGCKIAHSLGDAVSICGNVKEIFVVGGADIYALALPIAEKIYLTEIQKFVTGDATFPELILEEWQEASRGIQQQEAPEPLIFHFVEYQRKQRQ